MLEFCNENTDLKEEDVKAYPEFKEILYCTNYRKEKYIKYSIIDKISYHVSNIVNSVLKYPLKILKYLGFCYQQVVFSALLLGLRFSYNWFRNKDMVKGLSFYKQIYNNKLSSVINNDKYIMYFLIFINALFCGYNNIKRLLNKEWR